MIPADKWWDVLRPASLAQRVWVVEQTCGPCRTAATTVGIVPLVAAEEEAVHSVVEEEKVDLVAVVFFC